MKRCGTCGQTLAHSEFHKRARSKDGLMARCKACNRAAALAWHRDNYVPRERKPPRGRDPEVKKACNRRAEKRRLERDPTYASDRARLYRRRHPEKVKAAKRLRKTRERGAAFSAEATEYVDILANDPCSYCGGLADTVDHIDPIARGGDSSVGNLTAACARCNSRKKDRPLLVFLAQAA